MARNKIALNALLELQVSKPNLRVKNREGVHREFKLSYKTDNLPKYAKTMASFANRDGGVLFFGVKDRPRELVGVDVNTVPDDVVTTNFLKEYFQPEILFQSHTLNIANKTVLAFLVKPSNVKPVICRKEKQVRGPQGNPERIVLREGAVYYRYSASSDEIKYADLRNILDEQRESFFRSMVDNITLLNKVGLGRAAVVDAEELAGNDQAASVYITNDTAKNLNWIDSGRFVEEENEGDKAYYVLRKVEIRQGIEISVPTDFSTTHPLTKTAISRAVRLNGIGFEAIAWKLGIKDNPKHHISTSHGKNKLHKFTENSKDAILDSFPIDMENRSAKVQEIIDEYKSALR